MEKNVWLNFLGNKKDGVLSKIVLNFIERNGSSLRSTIFYGKSRKTVSTGRHAITSSKVNCRVPVAHRAKLHWTICVATQQPRLKPRWLCCLKSSATECESNPAVQCGWSDLKERVRTCWESLDQRLINKSTDQWHDRLKAVVPVNGGRTEQLFWISCSFFVTLCYYEYRMHS